MTMTAGPAFPRPDRESGAWQPRALYIDRTSVEPAPRNCEEQ
jgi:hypothetical protein